MSTEEIEKLKRNNQELLEIINNSWDGIGIIDKTTKFIYLNNAFIPILGFSKDEIIEKNFITLMDEDYKKKFLNLLNVKNQEKKYKAEITIACTRKDKKKVYLSITISSMLNKNLFVINTKDITSDISDSQILDDYVISMHTDLHNHIKKVSSAFLKLSRYEEKDILGKPFSSLAHYDTDLIVYRNIDKSLENLQEWNGKLKLVRKDGSAFWINLRIKPIFNKYGDVTGYTSLMFDITNEINLNDESFMLQEQISTAKNEIEQKDLLLVQQSKLAVMTETLQKLSHEWRQPLNLISIQAQKIEMQYALEEKPSENDVIETLVKIKKESKNLSQTIEDFQDFLKPKRNKVSTNSKKIIEKAVNIFSNGKESLNIDIIKDIEEKYQFNSFEDEICIVLVNVLKNSYEAINKRDVENGVISITQYHTDNSIVFEISDNAKGIDEEIIHKVFEPYFSTKKEKHGVGLGLYTSKLIVSIHLDGVMTIQNHNTGVTVKISIPIEEGK